MTSKNSENSPLHIAEVRLEQGGGGLGLTLCPGKKDVSRSWDRDLGADLRAIRAWGATTVVTLIEDHEFRLLRIETLADDVRALGMNWVHLPIVDVNIPDSRFESAWVSDGPKLHDRLDAGEKILIHCRGASDERAWLPAAFWSNAVAHRRTLFNGSDQLGRTQ